jgi:hypothetical protein
VPFTASSETSLLIPAAAELPSAVVAHAGKNFQRATLKAIKSQFDIINGSVVEVLFVALEWRNIMASILFHQKCCMPSMTK